MKVMVIVKATQESETGSPPDPEMLAAMGRYNEELIKAGILLAAEGLKPTSAAVRMHFDGANRTVIDGPFAETKELIAGFWLWQVRSMEEAVEWLKKCPNPMMSASDVDIRPLFEAEDFAKWDDAIGSNMVERREKLAARRIAQDQAIQDQASPKA